MKAFLMYKDRDFHLEQAAPSHAQTLIQDLELNTLFGAMALHDEFLFEVAKKAVLSSVSDLATIRYRQDILKDCLKNHIVVRDMYNIAVEAIENEKKHYFGLLTRYPSWILRRSVDVLQMFAGLLKKLRDIADNQADEFASEGFGTFFAMLEKELDDEYFACIQEHLCDLKFPDGVLVSAELGQGNEGAGYILRKPKDGLPKGNQHWLQRLLNRRRDEYTVWIAERDESGARALSELRDRGINLVANALAQSADHILSFFTMLRTELAFYVGCLNLYSRLAQIGGPSCFPLPAALGDRRHSFEGLYDVCLALVMERRVVGNDVRGDNKDLVVITGANQGGKSTFLRSIGLAQLMMQCGIFVPAAYFRADVCAGIFTHYKREEDTTMQSGKLDEELAKMSEIVDNLATNSVVLFNESFAATNEREGSEIARQIISALLEKGIKVFFVTHLFEFAHSMYRRNTENAIFLRAERQPGGERTFKLLVGEPLQTSFGKDLYNKIFGDIT
jgi:Mismatch repair ATPase (MutS family)